MRKIFYFSLIFSFITFFPNLSVYLEPVEPGCLTIGSPPDFYYNTVLLSWTSIISAEDYVLEYKVGGESGSLILKDHWLQITASDWMEWELFVSVGTIEYRVTARDGNANTIDGPTEWAEFTCYRYKKGEMGRRAGVFGVDPDCLSVCNPPGFYYNTILLSWTPINGADFYRLNMLVMENPITIDIEENWFRIVADNPYHWEFLVKLMSIAFNVEAFDSGGNLIAGPTEWSLFIRYWE